MRDLGAAIGLMLLIEGAAYALFPDGMRRLIALVQGMPSGQLRQVGMGMAVLGVALVWVVRRLGS